MLLHRLKSDFRLSIITLLGVSAVLGITPFAVMRFFQGNVRAGLVDSSILLGICAGVVYAWWTGDSRRSGLFLAIIACGGAVAIGRVVGDPGLFWLYPCLVTTFFLTAPRIATALNLASVAALMVQHSIFHSNVQMWTFAATALVVSASAYVFAYRNQDQRERLEHLATIDPLTGVRNRRAMDEELDIAAANAERTGLPYAAALLDIDHFKKVNDEYGHSVGDEILVSLATLIQQNTRKADQLFRYGGEEFVLLLPGIDGAGLKAVMSNLQQVLRKYLKVPGGGPVTASFGVAQLQHGESVSDWLARADNAMYEAKESGRDCIIFADIPVYGGTAASTVECSPK